jgi:two-component system KDP operon response regulator KdpE
MTRAMHQILVVEDEPDIRTAIRALLDGEGYRLVEAATARRGEIEARTHKPDLILLDLGLPDGDGVSVIRHVREYSPVPIVVLSARTMEEQKIAALDAGADDYVTKPFSAPELLARVRAALRRNARGGDQSATLRLGAISVDLGQRTAVTGEGELHLTPLEYRVLGCLARNVGLIVTQNQLVREVWGPDRVGDTRSLRVAVKNLRHKLEPDPRRPRYLTTEAGLGYRLRVDEAHDHEETRPAAASPFAE